MKKSFVVSASKSLGRNQNYVLILDFERNILHFTKNRRGKEVSKSFPFHTCVKLEKLAGDKNNHLHCIFGHEPTVTNKQHTTNRQIKSQKRTTNNGQQKERNGEREREPQSRSPIRVFDSSSHSIRIRFDFVLVSVFMCVCVCVCVCVCHLLVSKSVCFSQC